MLVANHLNWWPIRCGEGPRRVPVRPVCAWVRGHASIPYSPWVMAGGMRPGHHRIICVDEGPWEPGYHCV